ncbi:MAG: glycosyltransferase family 4 protein [Candidatus Woesebacteria bacterium]|nr:MAG: glycosyltransferase family 4 protein [Candidatus Woesebacteria bacterium]
MNILILSWRDPKHPLAGGAEQSVWEHAKGWRKAGNEIIWFSSRFKGSVVTENIDGIKIVRNGYQYLGVQIAALFYYFKNVKNVDLVVDQFHGLPFFTPLYVKKPKLALIQEVAGKVWLLNPLPFPINLIIGAIGFVFEPFIFLLYRHVQFMTGSESAKLEVSKFGIPLKNITVVPHGVILPKLKIKNEKLKMKTITFLGTLAKDKGIEDAIECFSLLDKKGECNFWIIGKPETEDYFKKIKSKISDLGLNDKVKFWGRVTDAKKFELLAKSHVLVNPSAHEGWGLVNIEANAVGTPVVAYKSSGLVDSVKDGQSGVIVSTNSPEKIANVTISLFENKKLYEKLQRGSMSWSKNFSWTVSRAKSLLLLNKVFNAGH